MAPRDSMAGNRSVEGCRDLLMAQLEYAKGWRDKAEGTDDVFAQFFFLYTAFNALYFAWNQVGPRQRIEKDQVVNLLKRLSLEQANEILRAVGVEVRYFCERRPIQSMKTRSCDHPLEGTDADGASARDKLKNGVSPEETLMALGEIIYFVRCNLVHGSKAGRGDDKEVITNAVGPLREILRAAIAYTKKELASR